MLHQATQKIIDWIDTLPEQEKMYASDMHQYLENRGIKPRMYQPNNFQYWFKGNRVIYLRENTWRNTPLDIAIPYNLKGNTGSINSFVEVCYNESDKDELIQYIIDNICCCDRGGGKCNTKKCGGRWEEFAGTRRKIALCHNDITKWKAPKLKLSYTDDDLYRLKRLVDIRIKYILQYS